MSQKFPRGTLVRVTDNYPYRKDLIGSQFFVDVAKYQVLRDRISDSLTPIAWTYQSPYKSIHNEKPVYIQECYLEEVDPDEGFEFEEDWFVWTPKVTPPEPLFA